MIVAYGDITFDCVDCTLIPPQGDPTPLDAQPRSPGSRCAEAQDGDIVWSDADGPRLKQPVVRHVHQDITYL